ncbi:oxidoreductase [Sinomicrobium sp. M5D2P17]
MWTKDNIPDQKGKTVIVTGANTGIGFETALALYEKGADVTLACRNLSRAEEAREKIQAFGGYGTVKTGLLNLANLVEVKKFADSFKTGHGKLDILVNNAGVMIPPPSKTDDGFELQFGVNFIGHFALTGFLFPLLKQTPGARVVTLSSGAATRSEGIDFENLKLEKPYSAWREYDTSKLADVLFAYELDRRLKALERTMISAASHPGVTRTDLQRHIPSEELDTLLLQFENVMEPGQGALPTLFATTDPSVKGGEFYGPDGENEYSGYPALSRYSTPAMQDKALAGKLWEYAQKAIGVQYPN